MIMLRKVRNAYKNISQETQNEKPLKNAMYLGKIILKLIFQEQGVRVWAGFNWL
jgi:hypothetical protein